MTLAPDPILVGLALWEEDSAPLRLGAALAALIGAPLVLLHADPFEPQITMPPPRWERDRLARGRRALEELASPLRPQLDVRVDVKASPSPVRALHESAEELGAWVIVAGATRRAGLPTAAPGGVADRLLHAAPCAVAIAPPGYTAPPGGVRRIGVAFADGPEGRDALAVASGLAERGGGTVTTYTVVEPPRARSPGAADDESERRLAAILGRARRFVPPGVLRGTERLEGDAADELTRVSAGLDLLICGSRGYGPVRSALVGGVSSRLARTAACPLLVIPRAPVPGLAALTGRGTEAGGR